MNNLRQFKDLTGGNILRLWKTRMLDLLSEFELCVNRGFPKIDHSGSAARVVCGVLNPIGWKNETLQIIKDHALLISDKSP